MRTKNISLVIDAKENRHISRYETSRGIEFRFAISGYRFYYNVGKNNASVENPIDCMCMILQRYYSLLLAGSEGLILKHAYTLSGLHAKVLFLL